MFHTNNKGRNGTKRNCLKSIKNMTFDKCI